MNNITTFENFDKEIKKLEMDNIRIQEQIRIVTKKSNELLEELKNITGKNSLEEIVDMMKIIKEQLTNSKAELDIQISTFNEDLKKYGELDV